MMRGRIPLALIGGGVGILLIGAALGWSITAIAARPAGVESAQPFSTVRVQTAEVGSRLEVNVVARWVAAPIATNRSAGTITEIRQGAAREAAAGDVLYTVDTHPVAVAVGDLPAYRDLTAGATGNDVSQLQEMLRARGHLGASRPGVFDGATVEAVRAWQRAVGVPVTGRIDLGQLVFIPALPARLFLDPETVRVGAVLSGGEPAVWGVGETPEFTIPLTSRQASTIPRTARIVVTAPSGDVWEARVGTTRQGEDSSETALVLAPTGEGPLCAESCSDVPVAGNTRYPAAIELVPVATGLSVPTAALVTEATGGAGVIDRDGARHPVSLGTSAKGITIITGVAEGLEVRVPGDTK